MSILLGPYECGEICGNYCGFNFELRLTATWNRTADASSRVLTFWTTYFIVLPKLRRVYFILMTMTSVYSIIIVRTNCYYEVNFSMRWKKANKKSPALLPERFFINFMLLNSNFHISCVQKERCVIITKLSNRLHFMRNWRNNQNSARHGRLSINSPRKISWSCPHFQMHIYLKIIENKNSMDFALKWLAAYYFSWTIELGTFDYFHHTDPN